MDSRDKDMAWRPLLEQIFGRCTTMAREFGPRYTTAVLKYILNTLPTQEEFDNKRKRRKGMENMRRDYTIELRINFEDDSRHKVALHMMRRAARTILTQAAMLSDGREPQVMFTSGDFFEGGTEESLKELSAIEDIPETAPVEE